MFNIITQEQKKLDIATNIIAREHEIYGYQMNIDNYNQILNLIPVQWPDDLIKYRHSTQENLANELSGEILQQVCDLQFREVIEGRLKIEIIEQNKSIHVRNALIRQVPEDEIQGLIAQALQS